MLDIGPGEFLVLAVAALLVFGPERLPKIAAQAGRGLRQLRGMAAGARRDLRDHLGPEFDDLDVRDLNPRSFVRKHLFDDLELRDDLGLKDDFGLRDDFRLKGDFGLKDDFGRPSRRYAPGPLRDGERPPHDPDAT